MDSGLKRAVLVDHRRAGKDKTCLNFTIKEMFQRVGAYYYFFPTYAQGRKILWQGADRDGMRFLDHFPPETIAKKNDQEMIIELVNGSLFQVIGTDNYDRVIGTNPIGCVFSEYSLQDPRAWDLIRPILAENGGWAVFPYTPRGKNHGFDLYVDALKNPKWYVEKLSALDTGAIPADVLADERRDYEARGDLATFEQEYFCSFEGALNGSYYGKLLTQARAEKRIGRVPWEPTIPVSSYWDLAGGMSKSADSTAIWFVQSFGREFRAIDYYEASGEGIAHYAKILREKPYVYGVHVAPHDINVGELGTGQTRLKTARNLGIRFEALPKLPLADGIEAVRNVLPMMWFDAEKCDRGLKALDNYQKSYDHKLKCFRSYPQHDWSSHGADAFRYFALHNQRARRNIGREEVYVEEFQPLSSESGY